MAYNPHYGFKKAGFLEEEQWKLFKDFYLNYDRKILSLNEKFLSKKED